MTMGLFAISQEVNNIVWLILLQINYATLKMENIALTIYLDGI